MNPRSSRRRRSPVAPWTAACLALILAAAAVSGLQETGIAASNGITALAPADATRAGDSVDLNTAIARSAWRWALSATVLQIVDGFVLLAVLPKPVLLGVMRGGLAILGPLTLSILLGIGLLVMLARASNPVDRPGLVSGTLAALILTIAVMTVTRHQIRVLYLEPATSQFSVTVVPQWANFVLFSVLLVLGLATVFVVVRRVLTSPAEGDEAA